VKKDMVFNPIRDGLVDRGLNEKDGITQPMVTLVNDIKGIMARHSKYNYYDSGGEKLIFAGGDIKERSKNPTFNRHSDLLTDHMAFRKRNSGRLVAKFLLGFL
jgi:hypothetical protein